LQAASKQTVRLPDQDATQTRDVVTDEVSAGYLRVLGIPLVAGRAFDAADGAGSDAVIVNESLARMYWGENVASAVGRTIIAGRPRHIIGVARDVRTDDVEQVYARFYEPLRLTTIPNVFVRGPAARVVGDVEVIARQFDARMRAKVTPLAVVLEQRLAHDIALGRLASTLGGLALALATLGMLGVFAFWVQWRQRELGVRMALGARQHQIVALVLRGSSVAIGVGVAIGAGAAALTSRFLEGHLYGVSPLDPSAYGGVVALLAVAGLVAVYVPARRATAIDPAASLRAE
jgi:ABC-type antimicrobial peptide transport system permease subunit